MKKNKQRQTKKKRARERKRGLGGCLQFLSARELNVIWWYSLSLKKVQSCTLVAEQLVCVDYPDVLCCCSTRSNHEIGRLFTECKYSFSQRGKHKTVTKCFVEGSWTTPVCVCRDRDLKLASSDFNERWAPVHILFGFKKYVLLYWRSATAVESCCSVCV